MPKSNENRQSIIWVAVTEQEKHLIRRAAGAEDLSMSAFLAKYGARAALQTLEKPYFLPVIQNTSH